MTTNLKKIFTILMLLVVYISVIELNVTSTTNYEISIETTVESELPEPQQMSDDFLIANETLVYSSSAVLPSSESTFILLTLEKDIFRPPLFA